MSININYNHMLQQILALVFIALFIWRLNEQRRKKKIGSNEFIFWLVFWLIGALAIVFIRQIDRLVGMLGFSGAGINFLLYITVLILFYMVFKLRLVIAKLDANLTEIARKIALTEDKK
jgi:hypothetical protein